MDRKISKNKAENVKATGDHGKKWFSSFCELAEYFSS